MPIRSRYGVWLYSDGKDETNIYSLLGDYDDVYEVVKSLRPGMAFIDIGANAGVFSMIAGQRIGADGVIVAFEPSLAVFKKLIANASINQLRNFFPFMGAVGPSTGVGRFQTDEKHTGGAYLDAHGDTRVVQLGGPPLSALLASLIEDRKTMIKIDVEGAELDVIRSIGDLLGANLIETVIVEVNAGQQARFSATPQEIYAFMHEKGYKPRLGLGFAGHYNEAFTR
ncbi:FkbM family methyltransferase [Methylovirgula ligni]|nr:FkbM family methyltransferase [Methylovirgula ligni]